MMLTLLPPLLWKPTILDLEKKSKDVLRQQSEGAEGDGAAHQLDLQVFFFWHPSTEEVDHFFPLGTFRTELVLVFGCTRM